LRVGTISPTKEDDLSSNSSQEYIDSLDLAIFRDVLRTAGCMGVRGELNSDSQRTAAVFVHKQIWNGKGNRGDLLCPMEHRGKAVGDDLRPGRLPKEQAINRWQDERGD
jgi:hypothetical protein